MSMTEGQIQRLVAAAEEISGGLCDILDTLTRETSELDEHYVLSTTLVNALGDFRDKKGWSA